jgi:hypothetical protein
MRAVKLTLIKAEETGPAKRAVVWRPALRMTWIILSWVLWLLWEIIKVTVMAIAVLIGISLIIIGVLSHFVAGPPR